MAGELLAQAHAAQQKEQQTRTTLAERATPKVSPPGRSPLHVRQIKIIIFFRADLFWARGPK
jgi:hypothetical protein